MMLDSKSDHISTENSALVTDSDFSLLNLGATAVAKTRYWLTKLKILVVIPSCANYTVLLWVTSRIKQMLCFYLLFIAFYLLRWADLQLKFRKMKLENHEFRGMWFRVTFILHFSRKHRKILFHENYKITV